MKLAVRIFSLVLVLLVLGTFLANKRMKANNLEADIDDIMVDQAIKDFVSEDIGQRNVLMQGDALEYQRQQQGKGARTFDFDPMATPYGPAGHVDKITDTGAFFREAGSLHRNAALKVFNPVSGSYQLEPPLMNAEGLPGMDNIPLGHLAEIR